MMKRIKIVYTCLFLFAVFSLKAQYSDSTKNYSFSACFSKGIISPHHESFRYFIKNYTTSFELNANNRVNGRKLWHQLYGFPYVGLGYHYSDYGNPELLGNSNTLLTYVKIPIVDKRNFGIFFKSAAGISWLSKRYDLYDNKYNIAIGSQLNAYLNLNFDFDFKLTDNIWLITGIGLKHFSNGGTQQPNKGINIFCLQAGVKYNLRKDETIEKWDSIPPFKRFNEFSVIYGGGVKTLLPARKKKYFVSSISINAERQFNHKSRFGIGLDLFKDNSRKEYLLEEDIENPAGADLYYAGAHASYDLVFGKTSFTVQMGGYIWQKSKFFEDVYHRFGIKYRFGKHWIANLTLKTFWAAADFAEWGVGYRF